MPKMKTHKGTAKRFKKTDADGDEPAVETIGDAIAAQAAPPAGAAQATAETPAPQGP